MSKAPDSDFATEAEMVSCWVETLRKSKAGEKWTIYAETAGWDLLLVHDEGYQLGLEAKLSLNAKVLSQALEGLHRYWTEEGPDYRGVLVPDGKVQLHMERIAQCLGIGIITVRRPERGCWRSILVPDERSRGSRDWPCWLPQKRCQLPDYVPDVEAGHACPVKLTDWKVKAIKLMILLERPGRVTRADMKALQISPTRWTDSWHGFLSASPEAGGYVANGRTPDLKAQHPTNWAQIEADFGKWCPPGYLIEAVTIGSEAA